RIRTYPAIGAATNGATAVSRPRGWRGSLALWLSLVAIYLANGRDFSTTDTSPTTVWPLTIRRRERVYLDSQATPVNGRGVHLTYSVVRRNDHVLSRYPVAPALVVFPLAAPQVILLDWRRPGWDRDPVAAGTECKRMAKRSLAILMALTGVIL